MKRFVYVLALFLAACGGGGGSGGGSILPTTSSLQAASPAPSAPVQQSTAIAPPATCSVAYWGDSISALTGPKINPDLSVNLHAVVGGTAAAAVPAFLQDSMAERFIVIEYGTNDANSETPLEASYRSMMDWAKAHNRTIVLTGMSHGTAGDMIYHSTYDLVIQNLAKEYGAIYANWPGVAYAGASDLLPDGVHPNDAYQQRLADQLSNVILAAAPECVK